MIFFSGQERAMSRAREQMEGGFRLDRMRRIKSWLYSVELMIIVVFVIALMYAGGEFSIVPFHLGVPSFLYFVLFMCIIIMLESFVFIRLETRFLKSPSSKYYLTKNAVSRAYIVIAVAAVFLLLFYLPLLNDAVKNATEDEDGYLVSSATVPVTIGFYSSDVIALTNMDMIKVDTDGGLVWVFIVSEEDYGDYVALGAERLGTYRINTDIYEAHPGMEYELPDLRYGKYFICLYSPNGDSVNVTVTTSAELSGQLIGYVPFFCAIFIVMNIIWILYLRPIKKVFENRAIYR